MRTVRFGVIGCGLMGREFISAASRWGHLLDMDVKPEVVAVCNRSTEVFDWCTSCVNTIHQITSDYRELLDNDDVEAVYIALPNHLHAEVFCAALAAGKHLLGEKPFGTDKPANDQINEAIAARPDLLVRCCSQFPFYPALQRIGRMIEADAFGQVIEVRSAFLHSSDLDPNKPINWKRMIEFNGAYGCLGDLGMHMCHMPFRAGWYPTNVRAILSDIIKQRPDGKGGTVPCETWDNATLLCEARDASAQAAFPLMIQTHRIAPGEKNTWKLEVDGTKASARFSTKNAGQLELLEYTGGEQVWGQIDTGYETAFKTISGPIFGFGFGDAILQMWAAFLYELQHGEPLSMFSGCATPDEVAYSHRLFTAALESQATGQTVTV